MSSRLHRYGVALGIAVRLLGWGLIAVSALLGGVYFAHILDFQILGYSNTIGDVSKVVAFPALALWAAHQLYRATKRQRTPVQDGIRRAFVFLRRQHAFLGWVVFATASAHGLYFVLLGRFGGSRAITGYLTWLLLLALVGLGWALDLLRRRRPWLANVHVWHILVAAVFLVALLLHT